MSEIEGSAGIGQKGEGAYPRDRAQGKGAIPVQGDREPGAVIARVGKLFSTGICQKSI